MWCIVNLPNGTQQAVKWDSKAIGQECLEKVCKALDIVCEMEYFGLEHWSPNEKDSRTRQWINLRNRLTFEASSGIQLLLALRVKFWVPVHSILQESVRDLFFMQAKADLLEGRLKALNWQNAARLAALLCQADGLRFNELSVKSKCPVTIKKECNLTRQQSQHKERKEKEHVLSFKKRRLSKQKSLESIDHKSNSHVNAPAPAASLDLQASSVPPATLPTTEASSCNVDKSNHSNTTSTPCNLSYNAADEERPSSETSPLHIYEIYIIQVANEHDADTIPEDFLHQIAIEHSKIATLRMLPKSAKYWLLQEIQELPGYGEELFSGVTANETSVRCDIAVGAQGITLCKEDNKSHIPFSAIAAAKSFRRTFKLEYVNDQNDRKELELKLPKHNVAEGLYRAITERHAFYVCDKVRGVVTNQFTRDLKGTIASMFKEDTELGKRYVFDIQHTCREVHDQARRILHEKGILIRSECIEQINNNESFNFDTDVASSSGLSLTENSVDRLDLAIREKEQREAAIERCVDLRISEAMTCKICMDRPINTLFNPCCHVTACETCAARCTNCPYCRVEITNVVKIYLPPELRSNIIDGLAPKSKVTVSS